MSTARERLAKIINNSGVTSRRSLSRADAVLADGFRRPVVLGYVIVTQDGVAAEAQYRLRSEAQDRADEMNSNLTEGSGVSYRVAEIIEAAEK